MNAPTGLVGFQPPSDDERRVFEEIVSYGRPRWETLEQGSLLRHVIEHLERSMREYLFNESPPSLALLVLLPSVIGFG